LKEDFGFFDKERKKEQKRKKAGRLVETAATVEIRLKNTRISTVAWISRAKNARLIHSYHKPDDWFIKQGLEIRKPKQLT